jgi:hypothetical protein
MLPSSGDELGAGDDSSDDRVLIDNKVESGDG